MCTGNLMYNSISLWWFTALVAKTGPEVPSIQSTDLSSQTMECTALKCFVVENTFV